MEKGKRRREQRKMKTVEILDCISISVLKKEKRENSHNIYETKRKRNVMYLILIDKKT